MLVHKLGQVRQRRLDPLGVRMLASGVGMLGLALAVGRMLVVERMTAVVVVGLLPWVLLLHSIVGKGRGPYMLWSRHGK